MNTNLIFLTILFIFSPLTSASNNYGALTVTEIISVYDGDTFRANLKPIHPIISQNIGIRVSGIDTPEIRGKCDKEKKLAQLAKQFTKSFLLSGSTIELRNIKRGKYFRIVADVYVDGISLTNELIKAELGYPYEGGTKVSWCN